MFQARARLLLAAATLSVFSSVVLADGVSVRVDFDDPAGSPFPSNRYTVFDGTQNTLRRVSLPKPDCSVRVSDCQDIDVINALDGFSTQPRITVPFTGDIDLATVNSDTIYLLNLGDTLTMSGFGDRVGINQVVWDPATKTLVFQSDQLLQQHSRYLLVVTDGVRDTAGKKLESGGWGDDFGLAIGRNPAGAEYGRDLRNAVLSVRPGTRKIVAASLFSTQSATTDLAKINRGIKQSTPAPVDFNIGTTAAGPVRALFPTASLLGIQFNRQTGTAPAFTTSSLPTLALNVVPGAIGQIAYGKFNSPDYETADKYIPATGTLTGVPQPQGTSTLVVQIFLPAVPKPANGWPVALFGHGFGDNMYGGPWVVASMLASQGIATASINVVGHGGGPLGTLSVLRPAPLLPVAIPAGGRGIDQDGNGTIASTEGSGAAAPRTIISSRDGLRQTVVDLMQLVREIEVGIDVDGDGTVDLDAQRINYAGQSFGGIYGTMLLGIEPSIKAGVPNVPGGSINEIVRLSPVFRPLAGIALASRIPSLINVDGIMFNENIPLRNLPPLTNSVAGAMDIQKVFDWAQWVQQPGNPVSYAAHIRKQPLPGAAPKPVLIQFAKGDMTVPNPTTSAILRAGDLADRATYFRNDLAFAQNPAVGKNPHTFLSNIFNPAVAPYAIGAQQQIAAFFASNGAAVIDPDGAGPFFEVPIVGPLPETLNFIP
jgi:Big-like domain-containing protein